MYTCDLTKVPEHIRYGIFRYVMYGNLPGDFLSALLCNRFAHSIMRADEKNREALIEIAYFLLHELPIIAWGSERAVSNWAEIGGLKGDGAAKLFSFKGDDPSWWDPEDRSEVTPE